LPDPDPLEWFLATREKPEALFARARVYLRRGSLVRLPRLNAWDQAMTGREAVKIGQGVKWCLTPLFHTTDPARRRKFGMFRIPAPRAERCLIARPDPHLSHLSVCI
jgi:hypothetical protein